MKRGALRKANAAPVTFWLPKPLVAGLDKGVGVLDLDRSKFIRAAVREKLQRHGVTVPESEPTEFRK